MELEQSKSNISSQLQSLQDQYSSLLSQDELLKQENKRLDCEVEGYSNRFDQLNKDFIEVKTLLSETNVFFYLLYFYLYYLIE